MRPSHRHCDKNIQVPNVLMRAFDQISEIKHSHENVWQLIFWCEGLDERPRVRRAIYPLWFLLCEHTELRDFKVCTPRNNAIIPCPTKYHHRIAFSSQTNLVFVRAVSSYRIRQRRQGKLLEYWISTESVKVSYLSTVGLLCPRGSFMSADFVCVLGYVWPRVLLAAVERKREREKSKIFSTTTL
jgi:hypothetical protein